MWFPKISHSVQAAKLFLILIQSYSRCVSHRMDYGCVFRGALAWRPTARFEPGRSVSWRQSPTRSRPACTRRGAANLGYSRPLHGRLGKRNATHILARPNEAGYPEPGNQKDDPEP